MRIGVAAPCHWIELSPANVPFEVTFVSTLFLEIFKSPSQHLRYHAKNGYMWILQTVLKIGG
jgi:hypothetical protein